MYSSPPAACQPHRRDRVDPDLFGSAHTADAAVYDTSAHDPAVRELVTSMMSENIAGSRTHIRSGQRTGLVDPRLGPAETAAWLTWMAERGFDQLVRSATDAEVERLVDAYSRGFRNTLYLPVESARSCG